MFQVLKNVEFDRAAKVTIPVDGGVSTTKLKTRFRLLSDADLEGVDSATNEAVKDFLRRVIVRFDDLADEAGDPLPYNDKVREQLLAWAPVRTALLTCYRKALEEGAEGN